MADKPLDLNNPETRQSLLLDRIKVDGVIVAKEVAAELAVSMDTIRRDLIALENQSLLKRVKGGAVAKSVLHKPFIERTKQQDTWLADSHSVLMSLLEGVNTLYLDGGTSTLNVANAIALGSTITVITPSPVIATCLLERHINTILLGGRLHPSGAIATGCRTIRDINSTYVDMAVLGACGLDDSWGLSAQDMVEAEVKSAMARQSRQVVVLASQEKLHTRAPYQVLAITDIDVLVTNGTAQAINVFQQADIEVIRI